MIGNKSRSLQWSIINSASCTGFHTDRCLNKELGGNLQWYINRGDVVCPGKEIPHQYSRIISNKTIHTDIHKIQRCQSNTSSSRQYCDFNIFDENGGYSKSENGRVGQGNLEISFKVGDHNYCRISPKRIKCSSRLGISKQFGLLRVDAESSNSSESLPNKGFSQIDFFASRLSHQIPTYVAGKQIFTVMQQMHFSRIGHKNSCMLFPHFARFQKFSTKHSRKNLRS